MDFTNELVQGMSIEPDNLLADTNGTSIDFQDCGPDIQLVALVGEADGSDATFDFHIEESDDESTWTDITSASTSQVAAAGHSIVTVTTFARSARYCRAVCDMGGSSPSADISVLLQGRRVSY
jgi:hypothetical protein